MARTGITYEVVAATAQALAAEDQNPTIRLVRKRLGDKGSPNTIQRHLLTWKQNRLTAHQTSSRLFEPLITAIISEIGKAAAITEGEAQQWLRKALADIGLLAQKGRQLEEENELLRQRLATAIAATTNPLNDKAKTTAA